MSMFTFYYDEMAMIHSKIKRLTQTLLTTASEISNGEEILSLYESERLEKAGNRMRKIEYELKDVAEDLTAIIKIIDEIRESVFYSEKYAYNALNKDPSKRNRAEYKALNSNIGNCTIPQDYTYVNSILISQLEKELSELDNRMKEIKAMKQYSDRFENDWFHPVGSYAAKELAAISQELSYYVSAIAASSALAEWYGQTYGHPQLVGFGYYTSDFNFSFNISNNANGTSWASDLFVDGYGLHTTSGTYIDKNAGLEQLEGEWEALTACHRNAKDASYYSGFRGGWTATPDSVTFDNDIDQYMYDHWYKNNPFFSFRNFMDKLYA